VQALIRRAHPTCERCEQAAGSAQSFAWQSMLELAHQVAARPGRRHEIPVIDNTNVTVGRRA
jgi:hypothetical protein